MAGKADHPDIVCHILAAELSAETDFVSFFKKLCFKGGVAESAACLVSGGRKRVVVVGGGKLNCEKVLLSRSAANHKGDVVRRTCGRSETSHLGYEERDERARVLDAGLGLLIEIGLVR